MKRFYLAVLFFSGMLILATNSFAQNVNIPNSTTTPATNNTNSYTFTGNDLTGELTVTNGYTLAATSGASVSVTGNDVGTMSFAGSSTVSGTVGSASHSVGLIDAGASSGSTDTFNNAVYAQSLALTGGGTVALASGTSFNGSISNLSGVAGEGAVTFGGYGDTMNGNIGSTGDGVNQVKVGLGATNLNGNVYATEFIFTGNGGNVTVGDGDSIAAPVAVTTNIASTINYAGSTTINNDLGAPGLGFAFVNFNGGTVALGANIYTYTSFIYPSAATNLNNATVLNLTANSTIVGVLNLNNTSTLNIGANTLRITGIYNQSAGTTLDFTANSASNYGYIAPTGAATLASGSLVNVTLGNNFIPNGTVLSIINAGAGSSYNLASNDVTSIGDPRVSFIPEISGNDLLVIADRSSSGFAYLATNPNAKSAGKVLDNITTPSSDMTNVLNTLEFLNNAQTASAINTMGPLVDRGVMDTSTSSLNNFIGASLERAQNVLTLASTGNVEGTGVSGGDKARLDGLWAKQYGGYIDQSTHDGIEGYNAWNTGTAVGLDHMFTDNLTIGASLGYAYGSVSSDENSASAYIDSGEGTLYAAYQGQDHPCFVDAAGSFANNWYDGRRDINVGTINRIADSQYQGQQTGLYLDGGYKFDVGHNIVVTPLTSLQWTHLAMGSYTETNAGALDLMVNRQSYNILESGLGAGISSKGTYSWGNLTPEFHAKWLYDFVNDDMTVTSQFTGGGSSFVSTGANPARDAANIGSSLSFDFKNDISLIAGVDTEIKDNFFGVYGSVSLRYKF